MRRTALILVVLLAGAVLWATAASGDGEGGADGDYLVRAYFDNAGFLVDGEEVRIAGARVGSIAEVDVSQPGEAVTEDGDEMPGKAVAVLKIDDPGFQDFRSDASCLIRPQSLLGEKFVECDPTRPRAPGSEPPPALEPIPDGEIGEGQLRLPLENNGKAVDIDLVNNVMRESEVDRFRLILNDLGAGLAARGDDLGEVLERANPALRETDEVLAILARQNRGLAQLAADSDQILEPLARERASLAGFIRNATVAGQAAAERRVELAEGFRSFPPALTELESTMVELRRFARAGEPVARNLRVAAPGFTGATKALAPFSRAGTGALTSLGRAAEESGPDLVAANPVILDLRRLGKSTLPAAESLQKLFRSLRKTGGIDYLMSFILNSSNALNGFDDYGHFLRAALQISNCVDVRSIFITGCGANWAEGASVASATSGAPPPTEETLGELEVELGDAGLEGDVGEADEEKPEDREGADRDREEEDPDEDEPPADDGVDSMEGTRDMLEFLIGDGQ